MKGAKVSAADASRANVSGDLEASRPNLDQVYRRHGNWLVAFLRRRFSAQDAEDLAQEAYVRTIGAKTELRDPRAFLAKVALNAAREISEHKSNRLALYPADDADGAVSGDQEAILLMKQLALGLPEDLKVVFVMSRFAGLTNDEIAARCRISVKRVEARMTKALAMLAARLRE